MAQTPGECVLLKIVIELRAYHPFIRHAIKIGPGAIPEEIHCAKVPVAVQNRPEPEFTVTGV